MGCRNIFTAFSSGFHKGPFAARVCAEMLTKTPVPLLKQNQASSSTSVPCRCLKASASKRRNNLLPKEMVALQGKPPAAEVRCRRSCLSPMLLFTQGQGMYLPEPGGSVQLEQGGTLIFFPPCSGAGLCAYLDASISLHFVTLEQRNLQYFCVKYSNKKRLLWG